MAPGEQDIRLSSNTLKTARRPKNDDENNRVINPLLINGEKFDSALGSQRNYRTLLSWFNSRGREDAARGPKARDALRTKNKTSFGFHSWGETMANAGSNEALFRHCRGLRPAESEGHHSGRGNMQENSAEFFRIDPCDSFRHKRLGTALQPGLGDGDHGCQFVHT